MHRKQLDWRQEHQGRDPQWPQHKWKEGGALGAKLLWESQAERCLQAYCLDPKAHRWVP